VISIGDHKTRKKDVLERMFRQQLTKEAMERIQGRKEERLRLEEERTRNVIPEGSEEGTPAGSMMHLR
jgi:hypothetical protein